jgi:DNA polymerase III epsilon subunit-like protein
MLKELAKQPWLLEQIDEAEGASKAMGFESREKLLAKAIEINAETNNGSPADYGRAATLFSEFCQGSEAMIGHNVMFDYAIMRRLYQAANKYRKGGSEYRFPFRQEQIVDTLALSALDPTRFGKRNSLDAIIDDEPKTADGRLKMESDIRAMEGVGIEGLKRCLNERTTINRLDPNKGIRGKGGHDAIEDVFITAAVFERLAKARAKTGQNMIPGVAQTVQDALGGTDMEQPALAGKSAITRNHPHEKLSPDTGQLAGFIHLPLGELGKKHPSDIVKKMIGTLDSIDTTSPKTTLSPVTDRGGILLNLQKAVPSLSNLVLMRRLCDSKYDDVFSAVWIEGERDYRGFEKRNGFSKVIIVPRPPERWVERTSESVNRQYVLSPYELIASGPYLRWDDPEGLKQDIEVMANLYQFISPYGSRVRFEPIRPAGFMEKSDHELRNASPKDSDQQWLLVGAPINGLPDGVNRAHNHLRQLYAAVNNAVKDGQAGPIAPDEAIQYSLDPVDQRACVRIRKDVFMKLYEAEKMPDGKPTIKELITQQEQGQGKK